MSVIKSKRQESTVQFLDTARKIYYFTKRQLVKLPKRYTFFGIQQTYTSASKVLENVKRGNSIYPTNAHEVQVRRDYFMAALAELFVLSEYIKDIRDTFPISDNTMIEWSNMLVEETRLIKGVLERDKERYKKAGLTT